MAEIGKDGQNLFQSIFHPLKEDNHEDSSSTADCLNVNNCSQNVNKHVDENKDTTLTPSTHLVESEEDGLKTEVTPPSSHPLDLATDVPTGPNSGHNVDSTFIRSSSNTVANTNNCTHGMKTVVGPENVSFQDPLRCAESIENGFSENGASENSQTCNRDATELKSEEDSCEKVKRGIHFPPDTCISGYHEPPDPWKNAPCCTTEEMVSAYKKSCEAHSTKPSAKVIQQLQAMEPVFGKREDSLVLKGEKLDQRQCEALEEILRRVQFKLLDLEACHLDDESVQALFEMIEYYESACQLNISFNKNINARGWQACSRLVRRTPCLNYLDIRSCDLDDRTIPLFGRALKLGCHLTILHMENMSLSGKTLVILVAALKMNETLQELFLAENKLMPLDGVHLGQLLRYNHRLGLLDLRNNHLQDVGTNHICEGLLEQGNSHGLRTLVLWNNQINYQAMPALGKALAHSETLETLNIGHNPITNEGAHLLKDGLLKTYSLLRLGLQGTRISDEGAVALAEYIADSTILLRVDLRDNDIKTGGLMALSHALRVNTSVTRIDLDKEPKKESYMKDYAEQQGRLLRDILTFQQRNIESALQREEEARAELERRAEAAATGEQQTVEEDEDEEEMTKSDATRDTQSNANAADSAVPSASEGFTIIDKSEAVAPVNESEATTSSGDASTLQRPNQLFQEKRPILRAQASLDSPMPSSTTSTEEEQPQKDLCVLPQTRLLPEAPPAESLLSPQYVPRIMARKIFSVSRVDEDNDHPQLSVSPLESPMAAWDPLQVASLSEVPTVLSSSPSTSSPASSNPCTDVASSPSQTQAKSSQQTPDLPLAQVAESEHTGQNKLESSPELVQDTLVSQGDLAPEAFMETSDNPTHESSDDNTNSSSESYNPVLAAAPHTHTEPDSLPATLALEPASCIGSGDGTTAVGTKGDLYPVFGDGDISLYQQQTTSPPSSLMVSSSDPSGNSILDALYSDPMDVPSPEEKVVEAECYEDIVEEGEEESWLSVGREASSEAKERVPASQPDFFTTLSMNGLTQELASALTSLDMSELPL